MQLRREKVVSQSLIKKEIFVILSLCIFLVLLSLLPLQFMFLLAYCSFSSFFFLFPKILHKAHSYSSSLFKAALSQKIVVNICHRGDPRRFPQNTIKSFESAQSWGDMLQMDVCVTKDNQFVAQHDLTLKRMCGVDNNVHDTDFKDLPRIQNQVQLQFAEQGRKMTTNNETIPTLEEVFEKFPLITMNIQLKSGSQADIVLFVRLLHRYNRTENTIIGIRKENHEQLALLDSKTIRFCSDSQVVKIVLAYFTGLLPFLNIKEHALQIPLFTFHFFQWKQREWKNPIKTYLFFGALRIMNWAIIPMVWHLRQRGIMTFYWVCNSQEQFERAVACGAAGIMTDQPQLLKHYLQRKGLCHK